MYKPSISIKSLKHQDIDVNESLSVLCWNVAKLTLKGTYQECLKEIVEENNVNVLLLQEVKKDLTKELDISDFSYVLSPNIQTKKHLFGVLSAFKTSCEENYSLLSQKRELKYATHKVTLITKHKMSNTKELLIVNLHAINFVRNSDFKHELESIKQVIKSHQGAMIVAGDFNTWNRHRIGVLKEFARELSLQEVSFSDNSHVKKVFRHCLDYVFYRDIKLTDAKVIHTKVSDHNPIVATFSL